jgi:hypothetical protein
VSPIRQGRVLHSVEKAVLLSVRVEDRTRRRAERVVARAGASCSSRARVDHRTPLDPLRYAAWSRYRWASGNKAWCDAGSVVHLESEN